MTRDERRLLAQIAKAPAGEKLPIGALARIFGASQAVTVAAIEQLIEAGALDRSTLRPPLPGGGMAEPVQAKRGQARGGVAAAVIQSEIDAFLERSGMTRSAFSSAVLKSPTAYYRLKKPGAVMQPRVAARVRDYIAGHETAGTSGGATPSPPVAGGAEPQAPSTGLGAGEAPVPPAFEATRPTGAELSAGALPRRPTGAELVAEIEKAAHAAGVSPTEFARPLSGMTNNFLAQLRIAKRPLASTIARVRALVAGEPVPAGRGGLPGVVTCRRAEREALGLGPSKRELRETGNLDRHARDRAKLEGLRDIAETRAEAHERGVREVVEREAAEAVSRRKIAQSSGSVRKVIDTDPVRAAAVQGGIGQISAERRAQEFRDVAKPSDLIRRAQLEWPGHCARVKALADEIGLSLAEAWQRVIAAGIDCLSDPEAI